MLRDLDGALLTINIGLDAGLEVGTKLDVYREAGGGKYLGTVTVTKVQPKEAVCEFKPARAVPIEKLRAEELPRKGDSVGRVALAPSAVRP